MSISRSKWLRGLRRGTTATRLLRSRVWIPPGAWMFVSAFVVCGAGSGYDGPVSRPEKSCLVWCDWVRSRNLNNEGARRPTTGRRALKIVSISKWGSAKCLEVKKDFFIFEKFGTRFTSTKAENAWSYTSIPPRVSLRRCLNQCADNFTLICIGKLLGHLDKGHYFLVAILYVYGYVTCRDD